MAAATAFLSEGVRSYDSVSRVMPWTKSDSTFFPYVAKAIQVLDAGALVALHAAAPISDGSTLTTPALPAGTLVRGPFTCIKSTGTGATLFLVYF